MADQDGRHLKFGAKFLRHVTSSTHDENLKGDIFTRALYFSELRWAVRIRLSHSC